MKSHEPTEEEARAKVAESGGVLTFEQARSVLQSRPRAGPAALPAAPEAPAKATSKGGGKK